MNKLIRIGFLGALTALTLAVAAVAPSLSLASSAVKLGSNAADDQVASSDEDASSLTTHELKCSSGFYVSGVEMAETTWSVYPSIEWVVLTCRSIEDKSDSEMKYWPNKLYVEGWGTDYVREQTCSGEGGYVTGLKIDYDSYIKDYQVRCGEKVITTKSNGTQSVKIDNHSYSGDWVFDRTQSDDDETNLVCDDGNRVMTGIRLRYKEDSDEIAVTRMQLYCAEVQLR